MKHKIIAIPIQKELIEVGDIINLGNHYMVMEESLPKNKVVIETIGYKPQQLLLLSNEGSNKGELTVFTDCINDKIIKYNYPLKANHNYASNGLYNFKVISAYPKIDNLPIFSIDFVKEWCKNPIEEVEVEMEDSIVCKKATRNIVPTVIATMPKLTNGFVTIIEKDTINSIKKEADELLEKLIAKRKLNQPILYTEKEVDNLLESYRLYVDRFPSIRTSKTNRIIWFNKNKKK